MIDIQIGDCRTLLAAMGDQSVNCCVTSPPYFGLRDYGVDGQMGFEQTPDEYVAGMVYVFHEVRRVLRDDGTLWLNLGDSYGGTAGNTAMTGGKSDKARGEKIFGGAKGRDKGGRPKDLIGIPWRVALALQADGWYLRQDIIWHKPNAMPESVKDRCTKAHEYLFLLSKSDRYHFDSDAIKEDAVKGAAGSSFSDGKTAAHQLGRASGGERVEDGMRNKRSVWTVSTKPFKGAHFATFPPDLIEPCILAGCPPQGTVLDPFGGAGTTGLVAKAHGRNAVLLELNPEYAAMARGRIDAPVATKKTRKIVAANQNHPDLFANAA